MNITSLGGSTNPVKGLRRHSLRKMAATIALIVPLVVFYGCSKDPGLPEYELNFITVSAGYRNMPSGGGVLSIEQTDSPAGFGIGKIVDNNTSTKFVTPHSVFVLFWEGNSASAINYYTLTSAADLPESDPKSWSLYGSPNGIDWTLLDSRTNQLFSGRREKKSFELANTTAYKYYRLNVESNNGGASTQISELSIRWIPADIDDLMIYSGGSSYSASTPMGNHYANRHVTTGADKVWLNTAGNEPPVPASAAGLQLKYFTVDLYPFGTPLPADVNQHDIGDCGALAAMASMAYIYPEFVKTLIKDNGDDTFTVSMFDPQGLPVEVTVTPWFLAKSDGKIGAVSGKNDKATWATVLEKAIMKWNCIYSVNTDIGGIGSEHVTPLFTGEGNSFSFSPGKLDSEQLARAVRVSLREGKFVIGGFTTGDLPIENFRTVTAHAYTLMHSVSGSALFAMRNPWGFSPGTTTGGKEDGILNIPDNGTISPTIDLRIIDPGIAGTSGINTPYIPPVFSAGPENMRVSDLLRRSGR